MSDRELRIARRARHRLAFTIVVLVVAGCEPRGTVSKPAARPTVSADSRPAIVSPVRPAEEAPLLLEDEPEEGAGGEPAADNSRCFVCHVNYMEEKLAVTHARANLGCANCHGPSDAHIADESWGSGGNGTAPDIMYPRDKINPSCMTCHSREKIDTVQHETVLAGTPEQKVCTDCHGNHRLPQRRCKWK
jgi:hypothetical protein